MEQNIYNKLRMSKYYKFLIYTVIVVLVNIASITLFLRFDLTTNNKYSLSKASKKVVKTLKEPLTIKVFFTKNLPGDYNKIERYLHDLLSEYAASGNKYFNYVFYNVSSEEDSNDKAVKKNQDLAHDYGIYPVQIQNIEKDEMKIQKAYMGMVIIHGDVIEKIPSITSMDGLEYLITTSIQKLNNKISALLNISGKIQAKLYLSSSLKMVGPYLNIPSVTELQNTIEDIINKLNDKNYGKIDFSIVDTTMNPEAADSEEAGQVIKLQWPPMKDRFGNPIEGGDAHVGLVISYAGKSETIQILRQNPLAQIFGGSPWVLNEIDGMEDTVTGIIESILDINAKIGYISDHGTIALRDTEQNPMMPQQQQNPDSLANFNNIMSDTYSIQEISLTDGGIPDSLECIIIAGPREQFSDWELFQIDQFLMKGKSIAFYLDPLEEIQSPGMMQYQRGPQFMPIDTGLQKLLRHYGIDLKNYYVLDEKCYVQNIPQQYGGGQRPIYIAPMINQENINNKLSFMNNIKGFIVFKIGHIDLLDAALKNDNLKIMKLFSTSKQGWVNEQGNFNPMMAAPPSDKTKMKQIPLAYMLEGEFTSYFKGKPVPQKELTEEQKASASEKEQNLNIAGTGDVIEKSKKSKIFVVGSSELLKNNLIDQGGRSPNAMMAINILDYLNNNEELPELRSKVQTFNPLKEKKASTRLFAKYFNIAGLPLIVILLGILVWIKRSNRKKKIQELFNS